MPLLIDYLNENIAKVRHLVDDLNLILRPDQQLQLNLDDFTWFAATHLHQKKGGEGGEGGELPWEHHPRRPFDDLLYGRESDERMLVNGSCNQCRAYMTMSVAISPMSPSFSKSSSTLVRGPRKSSCEAPRMRLTNSRR